MSIIPPIGAGEVSTGFYNGVATQSLRFEDGDSSYLLRTPGSASNTRIFTISMWVKRGNLSSNQNLMNVFVSASPNNQGVLRFNSSDQLQFTNFSGEYDLVTNRRFRDTTNWYHIVISVDTTRSTASHRVRIYINGEEQTSLATSTYPNQILALEWNTANKHLIGARTDNSTPTPIQRFDGYLAEVNMVDGHALKPEALGEDKNGTWIPKAYGIKTTQIAQGTGTAIGDMTSGGGLAGAFNGTLFQEYGDSAQQTASNSTSFIGKNWGSSKSITGFALYSNINFGFVGSLASTFTVKLYGKNGAPSNSTDGTLLFTSSSVTDANSRGGIRYFADTNIHSEETISNFTTTAFTYHWVVVTPSQNEGAYVSEIEFYEDASTYYGANSFRLTFEASGTGTTAESTNNAANMTNIGDDKSGQGHNFSRSGLSSHDSNLPDSPENNFCVLNPLGKQSASALSEGNLKTVITSGTNSGRTPSSFALNSGKWYWEVRQSSSNRFGMGVFDVDRYVTANEDAGVDAYEWALITDDNSGAAQLVHNSNYTSGYGGTVADGHVVMVALDCDNDAIWFGKQGTWFNKGTSDNSATVKAQIEAGTTTNAAFTSVTGRLTPMFVRQTSNNTVQVNFGQDASFVGTESSATKTDGNGNGLFQYDVPSGFLAICSANLPELTIGPDSSTQAEDHFNAFLYTGDGTSNKDFALNTFTPDLAWVKARTTVDNNVLIDSSRVTGTYLASDAVYPNLHSNTLDEEVSDSHPKLITNGIQVSGGLYNNNTIDFVVWNWKANGGTTTTNNAGSNGADITGVIQANTTAGFSIVTFTGDNASGTNNLIAHGLGKKPAFYIVKDRDTNQYGRWMVYHHGLGIHHGATRDNLFLELTNFSNNQGFGSSDDNTSVLFEPAVTAYVNVLNHENIAYLWAEIEGYSKFGAYHGNGESNNFIHLGFRPKLLVIKRVDTTSVLHNWYVVDSVRSTINPIDFGDILCWDKAFVEGTLDSGAGAASVSGAYIDFCSTGFNCKTSSTGFNNGSGKYVYMAWAEQPFKFSNAR